MIVVEELWIHVVGLDDVEEENGLVLDLEILDGAYLHNIWLTDFILTTEEKPEVTVNIDVVFCKCHIYLH